MSSIIQEKLTSGTLKAWWDYRTGTLNDLAGIYNGTATGTPYFNRTGICLDGVNDYITTGDLDIEDNLTIFAYFQADSIDHAGGGTFPRIVDKASAYGMFITEATGQLQFFTTGVSDAQQPSTNAVELGRFVSGAGTFDSAAGIRKVFLNGLLDSTDTGLTGDIDTSANAIIIGDNNNNNRKFKGCMGAILIFEETLTESEIARLHGEVINKTF